jgi:hypothetical protein
MFGMLAWSSSSSHSSWISRLVADLAEVLLVGVDVLEVVDLDARLLGEGIEGRV